MDGPGEHNLSEVARLRRPKATCFLSYAGKWMELEIIMLSEVSQVQKDITLDTRQNICNNNPKDTVYQTAG
jgi:hypothetical protein